MRLFLFLGIFSQAVAQVKIEGLVKNPQENVVGASVLIYQKNTDKIITYTFSDARGAFSLSFQIQADSVDLVVKDIAHQAYRKRIANQNQKLTIQLEEAVSEIQEIEIKVQPVTIKEDTTIFNVKSFKSEHDRNIGDILKKLPGVEVTDEGLIRYKGKNIQKFYIENMDMLGNRYNIATQNIRWDLVEEIEFYENHQPIRLLDSMGIKGSNPSLNLRLSQKALAQISVSSESSSGFTPLLWKTETTLSKFFKKHQFLNILQANNTGIDLQKQLTEQKIDINNLLVRRFPRNKEDILATEQLSTPPISAQRFRFNRSVLSSLNGIQVLANQATLRYHLAYFYENNQNTTSITNQIFVPNDTIVFLEEKRLNKNLHLLQIETEYEQNLSSRYRKNKTTLKGFFEQNIASITGTNTLSQNLRNPFFDLNNEFQSYRYKGANVNQLFSNTYLSYAPQKLQFGDNLFNFFYNNGTPYRSFGQEAKLLKAENESFKNFSKSWRKFNNQLQVGAKAKYKNFFSSNQVLENDLTYRQFSPANENTSTNVGFFGSLRSSRYLSRHILFNLHAEYEPTWLNLRANNQQITSLAHWHSGSLALTYRTSKLNLNLSLLNEYKFDESLIHNLSFLAYTYRNVQISELFVPRSKSNTLGAGVFYNDLLKGWSFNQSFSISAKEINYVFSYNYLQQLEIRNQLQSSTPMRHIFSNSSFKKYWLASRTSLSSSFIFNELKTEQIQNNVKNTNIFRLYQFRWQVLYQYLSWLQPELNVETQLTSTFPEGSLMRQVPRSYRFRSNLKTNFIFGSWLISLGGEYYNFANVRASENFSFQQFQNSFYFVDASLTYKMKKFTLILEGFNLNAQKVFRTISIQPNIFSENSFELRPLNLLVGIRATF